MTLDLNGPLWEFALHFYGQPGIQDACLKLQDEANIDVIQLIAVLYADVVLGNAVSAEDISTFRAQAEGWREAVVLPLRGVRRFLKPECPDVLNQEKELLRTHVKNAELLAEQIQIAMANLWLPKRSARDGLSLEEAVDALVQEYGGHRLTDSDSVSAARSLVVDLARSMSRP